MGREQISLIHKPNPIPKISVLPLDLRNIVKAAKTSKLILQKDIGKRQKKNKKAIDFSTMIPKILWYLAANPSRFFINRKSLWIVCSKNILNSKNRQKLNFEPLNVLLECVWFSFPYFVWEIPKPTWPSERREKNLNLLWSNLRATKELSNRKIFQFWIFSINSYLQKEGFHRLDQRECYI